ncbi:MAG TPA: FdtA/QdtA family cupin domain-containing protein [Saprospiraceae bacterium]|nr:FdtA/QdtA family cupin domain-containing protein [Saprospiraceae bacterium]
MSRDQQPYLITFPQFGNPVEGYIAVSEYAIHIPFEVKRTFWTYYTPESITRGRHAHYKTEMVLIAAAGKIIIDLESSNKEKSNFILDSPQVGLYMPPLYWHSMKYSHNAIQIVLASTEYNEEDYIRDYEAFIILS